MTGVDIPIPECEITIHQPTIKEISMFGEEEFFKCLQTILIDKTMFDKGKMDLSGYNNFQIFMMVISEPEAKELKRQIQDFFVLLFPQ